MHDALVRLNRDGFAFAPFLEVRCGRRMVPLEPRHIHRGQVLCRSTQGDGIAMMTVSWPQCYLEVSAAGASSTDDESARHAESFAEWDADEGSLGPVCARPIDSEEVPVSWSVGRREFMEYWVGDHEAA